MEPPNIEMMKMLTHLNFTNQLEIYPRTINDFIVPSKGCKAILKIYLLVLICDLIYIFLR